MFVKNVCFGQAFPKTPASPQSGSQKEKITMKNFPWQTKRVEHSVGHGKPPFSDAGG
jgi:hypothetical protein